VYQVFHSNYPTLIKQRNKAFVSRSLNDGLYLFNTDRKDELTKTYELDFGNDKIPDQVKKATSLAKLQHFMDEGDFSCNYGSYTEIFDFSLFLTTHRKDIHLQVFDKRSETLSAYAGFKYGDTQIPIISPVFVDDDVAVSILPLYVLAAIKNEIDVKNLHMGDFHPSFENMNITRANPYMVLMKD